MYACILLTNIFDNMNQNEKYSSIILNFRYDNAKVPEETVKLLN